MITGRSGVFSSWLVQDLRSARRLSGCVETMKSLSLILLFLVLSAPANGQSPPIGIVDFYGLRTVSENQARTALQIKEGDEVGSLQSVQKEVQSRLEALPNVAQARLNFVCCEQGKNILYVGIRERGSAVLQFRRAPKGAIRLPGIMVQAGEEFESALVEGLQKGDAGEDDSQGHALFSYPKLRAIQERFILFAARDLPLLRTVLHSSSDAGHRALAAQIIPYTLNKREIVKDLAYGMSDPDGTVRNNSLRALQVLAVLAKSSPQLRIRIPKRPFVAMLNSIEWSDRNKSSIALYRLTEKPDPAILLSLRRRALPALVEMARWRSPGHALPSFFLLGRVVGFSEAEIQKAWVSGDRETLIETALKRTRKSRVKAKSG